MERLYFFPFAEKGYEEWDKFSSGDDQPIEERGLEDDEDFEFNVMPKLLDQQGESLNIPWYSILVQSRHSPKFPF